MQDAIEQERKRLAWVDRQRRLRNTPEVNRQTFDCCKGHRMVRKMTAEGHQWWCPICDGTPERCHDVGDITA